MSVTQWRKIYKETLVCLLTIHVPRNYSHYTHYKPQIVILSNMVQQIYNYKIVVFRSKQNNGFNT